MAFSFFNRNTPASQGPTTPEGQQPTGEGQQPTGQAQQQQAPTQQSAEPQSELDFLASLYNNNSDGDDDSAAPSFSLDPTKVGEAASKLQFAQVTEQDLQAIQNGDTAKLLEVINSVGRNAYAQALQHSTGLTNEFLNNRSEFEKKQVNNTVNSRFLDGALNTEFGESLQNPLVATQARDLAQRIQRKHPDAPANEVAKYAKKLLQQSTAEALGLDLSLMNSPVKQQPKAPVETDWEKEFGLKPIEQPKQ